ncbi:MAG: hypothetical protein PHI66_01105 [Candidatus Pacebacteria bacterium]|nr:hypothetical protein [Candidatus Paceibacterota bacterium]
MKRRKIWYQKYLFKNHFKSYKDWDDFNPSSDWKYSVRYGSDALICRNPECPREQMPISEHEAYYYFAKRHFWRRVVLSVSYALKFRRLDRNKGGCYICPFCGSEDIGEFKQSVSFTRDPRIRAYKKDSGKSWIRK